VPLPSVDAQVRIVTGSAVIKMGCALSREDDVVPLNDGRSQVLDGNRQNSASGSDSSKERAHRHVHSKRHVHMVQPVAVVESVSNSRPTPKLMLQAQPSDSALRLRTAAAEEEADGDVSNENHDVSVTQQSVAGVDRGDDMNHALIHAPSHLITSKTHQDQTDTAGDYERVMAINIPSSSRRMVDLCVQYIAGNELRSFHVRRVDETTTMSTLLSHLLTTRAKQLHAEPLNGNSSVHHDGVEGCWWMIHHSQPVQPSSTLASHGILAEAHATHSNRTSVDAAPAITLIRRRIQ